MSNMTVRKGICLNIGNCAKANSKEEITVNIGEEFVCPDCGGDLVEVKPAKRSKGLLIGGVVLVLAIIAAIAYNMSTTKNTSPGGGSGPYGTDTTEIDPTKIDTTEIDTTEIGPTKIDTTEVNKTKPTTSSTGKNEGTVVSESSVVTKDLGYAIWTGKMKNGKPHDTQGILKFKSSHVIDSRDDKGRIAGPGDRIIGVFEDGHLTSGKWYKIDGNVESIFLGGI